VYAPTKRWIAISEDYLDRLGVMGTLEDSYRNFRIWYRANEKRQSAFVNTLNTYIQDGSRSITACDTIINASRKINKKPTFEEKAALQIKEALTNGRSITEGMQGYFYDEIIQIFQLGWSTGKIQEILDQYIEDKEQIKNVKSEARSNTVMPYIYLIGGLIVCYVAAKIVPSTLPPNMDLNNLTSFAGDAWRFCLLVSYWGDYVLTFYPLVIITFKQFRDKSTSSFRRKCNSIFPFSIHTALSGMQMMKSISLLTKANMGLLQITTELEKTSTPYVAHYYRKIRDSLSRKHGTIGDQLDVGLISPWIIEQIHGIAETPDPDSKTKAIYAAGLQSGTVAINSIKTSSAVIVTVLWGLVGLLYTIIAVGIVDFSLNIDTLLLNQR
jgi:hypothetical protein